MRKFVVVTFAIAIAVTGYMFLEGKPRANACRGGSVELPDVGGGGTVGGSTGPGGGSTQQASARFSFDQAPFAGKDY